MVSVRYAADLKTWVLKFFNRYHYSADETEENAKRTDCFLDSLCFVSLLGPAKVNKVKIFSGLYYVIKRVLRSFQALRSLFS